jgi:hypothetical protein
MKQKDKMFTLFNTTLIVKGTEKSGLLLHKKYLTERFLATCVRNEKLVAYVISRFYW